MRIIAGEARGRPLRVPAGRKVRPTSDRVREALFNILGAAVVGRPVLDLFAGSGALGLEALSRGAARAIFVEHDPQVVRILAENVRRLGFEERARIVREDVFRAVPNIIGQAVAADEGPLRPSREPVPAGWSGIVFADPPYRRGFVLPVLRLVAPLLGPDGLLVLEHSADEALPDQAVPSGLRCIDRRRYGDTGISFFVPYVEEGTA
ncbi:MAG TPA: RsmD family RNA methyltransferase [Bacillota bacterium]